MWGHPSTREVGANGSRSGKKARRTPCASRCGNRRLSPGARAQTFRGVGLQHLRARLAGRVPWTGSGHAKSLIQARILHFQWFRRLGIGKNQSFNSSRVMPRMRRHGSAKIFLPNFPLNCRNIKCAVCYHVLPCARPCSVEPKSAATTPNLQIVENKREGKKT